MIAASAAIIRLIFALMFAQPFVPADVAAVGIVVTVVEQTPVAGASGWIGCAGERCEIHIVDLTQMRHEVCHGLDWLSDGRMDGSIAGWRPWLVTLPQLGEPWDDTERLGYWCSRQVIRP